MFPEASHTISLDISVQKTVAYAGKGIYFKALSRLNAYVSTKCSCTGKGVLTEGLDPRHAVDERAPKKLRKKLRLVFNR